MALTIGRKCKNVSIRESSEYIAGYFVLNYVSARDQLEIFSSSTSNIPGLRVSILLIPVDHGLTTVDEIIDPCNLHITTRENRDKTRFVYCKPCLKD